MSETSDETTPRDATSTGKTQPPMLINDSLPPVPDNFKKIQEGQLIEMAELLTDITAFTRAYSGE